MDWTQFIVMFLGMVGLFAWNRAEVNSDRREASYSREEDRKEIINLIKSIETEIKDFHGRLCAIEERNK